MSFVAASAAILNDGPDCTSESWPEFTQHLKMFFRAVQLTGIMDGSAKPTEEKELASWNTANAQAVAFIWRKVDKAHRYLVNDCAGADAAWKALKDHFNKPTLFSRMAARQRLYTTVQDPLEPIDKYIQRVSDNVASLTALSVTVSDTEIIDILLMGVDTAFHGTRTQLFTRDAEPKLDEVKVALRAAGNAQAPTTHSIKSESVLAAQSQRSSRPTANRVDGQGNTWCNPDSAGCHRCGRSGHHAPRCMLDMPSAVKDWIRDNPPYQRTDSAHTAEAEFAGHASWDDGESRILQFI